MAATEYRVSVPFRGVDVTEGNVIVCIPNGAVLSIINGHASNTFVTVRWGTRELLVFEQDLSERAVEEPFSGSLATL